MYSSSPSSSSQQSTPSNSSNNHLMRYGSAPSSFLSSVAESVSGLGHQQHHQHHQHNHQQQQFFAAPGDCSSSLSMSMNESTQSKMGSGSENRNTLTLLQDSYVMNNNNNNNNSPVKTNTSTTSNLIRHSSSPAGFLDQLTAEMGYSGSKRHDNYNNQGGSVSGHKISRLGSQLSFTKQDHHALSQISEVNECILEGISSHDAGHRRSSTTQARPTTGFSLSAWDDNNTTFSFSGSPSKRSKNINEDILGSIDSQQEIAFEMASMDRLMQIPQDSVTCKIRAKRGFATHPRSIAERERRTRISGKLKKLQELVPNMDKQTSYADMLDLAVQHIKGLQGQIQKLNGDLDRCTCGCNQNTHN